MRNKNVSIRGVLVRDMIHDTMETSPGKPIQTGEFRKNPVEPAWVCPSGYEYEIIDREPFKMEHLKPEGMITGRVVLQLRGGGYIGPMKNIYCRFFARYSHLSYGGDVLIMDYRMTPEHPYPAALEDVIHTYQWLVKEKHYRPGQVMVTGDPTGGSLALALCLYLRDHGMPQPAGLVLMSPRADLTCGGDSYEFNFENDPLSGNSRGSMFYNSPYISGADPKDPYILPIFGDFRGLLPMLLQAGGYEMLLSDTLEVAQNARRAGVKRRVSVYEGMFHVFQMSMDLVPESREAWDEVTQFMQIIYKIDRRPTSQIIKKVKKRRQIDRQKETDRTDKTDTDESELAAQPPPGRCCLFFGFSHIFGHVSYIEVKRVKIMAGREKVLKIFPRDLRAILGQVTVDFDRVQEIRTRTQKPLLLTCDGREYAVKTDGSPVVGVPDPPIRDIRGSGRCQEQGRYWARAGIVMVSQAQMKETVEYMCSLPVHAAEEELRQGFITTQGGHRTDTAGRTMAFGQDVRLTKSIFFINIRVAHQIQGCVNQVMDYLYSDDGRFLSTLVISPPRCGKTTLLRDMIRQVSDGPRTQRSGRRIAGASMGVVDKRSKLGACYQGALQNDLGTRTDMLDCCPKSQGTMMLVRSMTPRVIAVDEIGSREDVQAIECVRNCGCSLAATIHGSSLEDIMQKPVMGELIQQDAFERMILLDCRGTAGHVASI